MILALAAVAASFLQLLSSVIQLCLAERDASRNSLRPANNPLSRVTLACAISRDVVMVSRTDSISFFQLELGLCPSSFHDRPVFSPPARAAGPSIQCALGLADCMDGHAGTLTVQQHVLEHSRCSLIEMTTTRKLGDLGGVQSVHVVHVPGHRRKGLLLRGNCLFVARKPVTTSSNVAPPR